MYLCICICGVTYYAYMETTHPANGSPRSSVARVTRDRRFGAPRSIVPEQVGQRLAFLRRSSSRSARSSISRLSQISPASLSSLGLARGAFARRAFFPSAPSFCSSRKALNASERIERAKQRRIFDHFRQYRDTLKIMRARAPYALALSSEFVLEENL